MERPIIFNTENVKAILDGRKTMTRRTMGLDKYNLSPDKWLVTPSLNPSVWAFYQMARVGVKDLARLKCPYGQVGDRLRVRETWAVEYVYDNHKPVDIPQRARVYYKTQDLRGIAFIGKWRPSIFMPRWASRLTLEITGVRVERLAEISDEDAIAEGCSLMVGTTAGGGMGLASPRYAFKELWDSLNAKRGYGWETNPWVWVIKFDNIGVRVK